MFTKILRKSQNQFTLQWIWSCEFSFFWEHADTCLNFSVRRHLYRRQFLQNYIKIFIYIFFLFCGILFYLFYISRAFERRFKQNFLKSMHKCHSFKKKYNSILISNKNFITLYNYLQVECILNDNQL